MEMSVKFIKNKQVYDSGLCMRGLNILGHAQMIELEIGSLCGGHGKCGADRVILDPQNQERVNLPTAIERHQLTALEIERGMRLGCQCFPNADELDLQVIIE